MVSSEIEFLEERLCLLETWIGNTPDDDDNNEDLMQKREEYQGLIDETVLLQKKLRKTSKLLDKESDKNMLRKLSKKQDQYLNEIEEIMNYAESDVLFETVEIEPNELLGEPLETLVEQPGLEGSSLTLLNFSISDFMPSSFQREHENEELHPIAENNRPSICAKHHESIGSFASGVSLFTISTANSNTYNYDVRTLQRKLKKVEKLLAAENMACCNNEISQLNAIQVKKLKKKREQYLLALKDKTSNEVLSNQNKVSKDNANDFPSYVGEGLHEIDAGVGKGIGDLQVREDGEGRECCVEAKKSHTEHYHDSTISDRGYSNEIRGVVSHDKKTLEKKLKKVKKLIAAANNPEDLKKYKLKKKEYSAALQALKAKKTEDGESSSSCLHEQHEEIIDKQKTPAGRDETLKSSGGSLESTDQDKKERIQLLKKKLQKVVKSIAKARKENNSKVLEKMEKKRLEYQRSLDIEGKI